VRILFFVFVRQTLTYQILCDIIVTLLFFGVVYMIYILYNPLAGGGQGETFAKEAERTQTAKCELHSVIDMDMKSFVSGCTAEDKIILCGGDGTLNRFANDVYGIDYPCEIYLYKSGTGNDFLKDVEDKMQGNMLYLNEYIANLPTVVIDGEERKFINGIGFGIDGMCCEVADQIIAKGKKANYALISIKLLIHGYKCPNAVVTVDGEKYNFKRVWLASGMNGRYYGGGMMVAPEQDRLGDNLTSCIIHSSGKLKTLVVFPRLFKGTHINHREMTKILTGKEITVEFDIPTALQIDGETVLGVTSYTIKK